MRKILILNLLSVAVILGFVTPSASAEHCIVRPGDSMWKIAQRYNVPFAEILRLNRHYIDVHLIHPNDKIELPDSHAGTQTNNHSAHDNIPHGNQSAPESNVSTQANQVLRLVNAERQKQGLNELILSKPLSAVAVEKSRDMAENNYFSHTSPTYGSPFEMMQQYGIQYRTAGENIAAGQRTPDEVMQSWMNSSGHRANILNPKFTEIGIGYFEGGSYRTYWTQEFIGK